MPRKPAQASPIALPDISGLTLDVCHVRADTLLRVARRPGAELALDPARATRAARYDDFRQPAQYAVTYMGSEVVAATAEARIARSNTNGAIIVSEQHFHQALVVRYEADRELVLLSLTGLNVVRLNAAEFMWEAGYDSCQRFAAAVHDKRLDVDGIAYPSRKWPSATCYAIFDRGVRASKLRAVATSVLSAEAQFRQLVEAGVIVINPSDPGDAI